MLISSFLSNRKFRTSVKNKISTPTEIHTGVSQGSVPFRTFYHLYINDAPNTSMLSVYTPVLAAVTNIFSERYSAASHKRSLVMSAGILKLVKIRLRPSICLVDMEGRSHILY